MTEASREETCRICLESSPIANSGPGGVSRFNDVDDEDRLISPCACSVLTHHFQNLSQSLTVTCFRYYSFSVFVEYVMNSDTFSLTL